MAVSFSAAAKAEICKTYPQRQCCALAQCFGILLFCSSFASDSVRIITECEALVAILPKLFKKAFGIAFDQVPEGENGKMVFGISDPAKLDRIFESYGFHRGQTLSLHVNLPIVEEDCCKAAFLRGAFLAGGSVTDPEKSYHMELSTIHASVARETFALMGEVLPFYPKLARRGGGQVLYLKQSDLISDFLAYLGAPIAAMGIMEAKLEKEIKNKVNRRCNCDDANISKVVDAAQEQLAAIRVLRESGELEKLPVKMRQAAAAREAHPEASLTELAELMEPPISKSAMNHRLKKIMEFAKEAGV